jgi:hypothetical protein
MVFIDSNLPMYLIGVARPHKVDAQRLLERCIVLGERLVSDAEVLQEILHRYTAINRPDAIQLAFDSLLNVVDEIFSIEADDVEKAKNILLGSRGLSAREALHVSIMRRYDISDLLSFDSGFDGCPGVKRLV